MSLANKFYGEIGFTETTESSPGVWTPTLVKRNYSGDVIRNYKDTEKGESTNDNININNRLSIVADPYALNHFHTIKYVKWLGAAWTVKSVDVQYPRLILSIGGVYNGETS